MAVIALAIFALAGCATGKKNVGHQIAANKQGLPQLTVGMSKAQVMSTMTELSIQTNEGVAKNPFITETITGRDRAKYEVLYYVTRIPPPYTPIGKFLTTPVILKGGKYVGQGWDTLEKIEPPKPKK
ncbi:MAG TPA: hypothetical protein VJS66_08155 [Burkholderiales bacterium]|nr:hypothetical protein [Burkholderiales bacterium]